MERRLIVPVPDARRGSKAGSEWGLAGFGPCLKCTD